MKRDSARSLSNIASTIEKSQCRIRNEGYKDIVKDRRIGWQGDRIAQGVKCLPKD